MVHQYVRTSGQKKVIFGYMQQYMDGPTATPTHSLIHYIASIGSLKIYRHSYIATAAQYVDGPTATPSEPFLGFN
jgi:hypothetical protein